MEWGWLIPVIALVIWLLSNLARGLEQKKEPPAVRPAGPRPRSSGADIDRFLEEINRRRQQQQQRPREDQPPTVRPAETVQPVRQQPRPRPTPRPRPAMSPPIRRPAEPFIVAEPVLVAEPVVAEVLPAMQTPTDDDRLIMSIPPPPGPRKLPAHLRHLRNLLHSAQGIQAAVVLNEVLGRPRCRRR